MSRPVPGAESIAKALYPAAGRVAGSAAEARHRAPLRAVPPGRALQGDSRLAKSMNRRLQWAKIVLYKHSKKNHK